MSDENQPQTETQPSPAPAKPAAPAPGGGGGKAFIGGLVIGIIVGASAAILGPEVGRLSRAQADPMPTGAPPTTAAPDREPTDEEAERAAREAAAAAEAALEEAAEDASDAVENLLPESDG
ncbi:MAG: hypothetical protein AAGI53_13330 [Planctomycetota bacterium]